MVDMREIKKIHKFMKENDIVELEVDGIRLKLHESAFMRPLTPEEMEEWTSKFRKELKEMDDDLSKKELDDIRYASV